MKKSIIFIAAIIFAICFTACGNSGEKNTQTETTTNGIKLTEQQLEYLKKLRSDITGIEYVSEEDECEADEECEESIEYWAEPFNCLNPEHSAILKAQENEFWRV